MQAVQYRRLAVIQVGKPELRFRLLRPRGSSRSVFAHRAAASNAAAQERTGHAPTGREFCGEVTAEQIHFRLASDSPGAAPHFLDRDGGFRYAFGRDRSTIRLLRHRALGLWQLGVVVARDFPVAILLNDHPVECSFAQSSRRAITSSGSSHLPIQIEDRQIRTEAASRLDRC
jgi:hypothetical protein